MGDTSYCVQCNSTEHFTNSRVHRGTCVCDIDHDFVDNKCVRPKGPYVPLPVNKSDMATIPEGAWDPNAPSGPDGKNYTLIHGDLIQEGDKNIYHTFNSSAGYVVVLPEDASKTFYFEIESRENPFTVQIPPTTVADIECNSATLNLPPENKININGGGVINLNPIGGGDKLIVNSVKVNPSSNELILDSPANLTIVDLDISGHQSVTGQDPDKNLQTLCKLVKIEAESVFTATNLKFEEIKVGLRSIINIVTDNVVIDDAPIELYHLKNNFGNQRAPLSFTGKKAPGVTKGIRILPLDEGEPVPTENENFTVADFNINDNIDNASYNACTQMKKEFNGGEDFASDRAECYQDEKDEKVWRLIATKTVNESKKKDKGLSGGAIAGIVIACIVVVAAIIALLVYFLVIKKRNQSTTSTQGDSSIAI